MAALVLLLIAALLDSLVAQRPGHVFVKHGTDLLLDANTIVRITEETDFFWKFNSTNSVVKFSFPDNVLLFKTYKLRAYFSTHNYSLLINNVQHNGSGIYKATFIGGEDKTVAEYNVTVQDPVSRALLTVTPNSNLSPSCNLTATCTAQDSKITVTIECRNDTNCSLVKDSSSKITSNSASLDVYLREHLIICNHSNQVSWEHSETKILSHCETKPEIIPVSNAATSIMIGVGTTSLLAAIFCIVCTIYCKNNRRKRSEDFHPGENVRDQHEEDASGLSPTTTYALVQFHSGPENSVQTNDSVLPETVYAQVDRAYKSRPPTSNS